MSYLVNGRRCVALRVYGENATGLVSTVEGDIQTNIANIEVDDIIYFQPALGVHHPRRLLLEDGTLAGRLVAVQRNKLELIAR